jgi:predicted phosphohydrolase
MKIQYASDLHLEFKENKQWLLANPIKPVGDILLLAGDIVLFGLMDSHDDFFNYISDNFKHCYWIPGNHEYYYADLADRSGTLHEKIRSNVSLVNNVAIDDGIVRLVFSTLWTHISPLNQFAIQKGMSDFQVINYDGVPLTPAHYNQQHQACKDFLQFELARPASKTIVVTHHVPTLLNYPQQYRGSILNEGFAVELFDFIETSGVDYWIYGHHHQPVPTFQIGSTKLLTNQLGYVRQQEHMQYSTEAVVDVS